MALLFGGFFYSIVILLPNLRNNNLERKKISKLAKSFKIQALTDPLTGVHNRRYFNDALNIYLSEFGKVKAELGLIIIDLDHFKQINDVHGHDAGDQVLIEVAQRLKAASRDYDVVARIGGEEFAIITPCISKKDLLTLADRFRQMIADLEINEENGMIRTTASIGVATTSETSLDAKALTKAADKSLYAAKHAGRNQVAG
ncbi:MAG: GGDEF domain-containing protein [Salaquimonas sp.]